MAPLLLNFHILYLGEQHPGYGHYYMQHPFVCHKLIRSEMKTREHPSAKDDPSHPIEQMHSYRKCLMYRALMVIGDFGVNLLNPDDSFRLWTNRNRKINLHDISTRG